MTNVFAAVAVYVTVVITPVWHRVDVAPKVNTGVPTGESMVTECVALLGPLQPVAVAVITELPTHKALKVTSPVAASILFPPSKLKASRLYVMPVELDAVAP